MLPVELTAYISAPREKIYDVIADLALRPAWTDNYQSEFRLAHPKSYGEGAGARYLHDAPSWNQWVETTIVEADRPRTIVERTKAGRYGRSLGGIWWDLEPAGSGLTRVHVSILRDAGTQRERFKEKFGFRRWMKRGTKASLERLRLIFEEYPDRPLARATVAGFETLTAPRFGMHPQRAASGSRG
jgi:uncharacterized protein YndB with AHSA1/START domain